MTKTEFQILSCNGKTQIHCIEWAPDMVPRGIVQIAHGIASHIARFEPFAEFLCAHGFVVVGNDHLGHGQSIASDEDKLFFGESSGWTFAVGDMRNLTMKMHEKYPGLPLVLLGHSMGSFLARSYVIRFRDGIDALILSGTGQQSSALVSAGIKLCDAEILKNGPRYFSKSITDVVFGSYNRAFAPNRTEFDWLSRDEQNVDRYIADEMCGAMATVGLYRDMLQGIQFISKDRNLRRMNKELPVLFFSGEQDPVGEFGKGVVRAYMSFLKADMRDVTLKLYAGGRHEMLNETNRPQVYADLLHWIESKLS